jgi:drug/metabolite transporter (DMT)-like permease
MAILASVGGAWAWTLAARNLPVALAAQLIVSETAFGTIFGLAAHRRWPTLSETIGITVLIVGVIIAIQVFYGRRQLAEASMS